MTVNEFEKDVDAADYGDDDTAAAADILMMMLYLL